jgi:hypothetical protein
MKTLQRLICGVAASILLAAGLHAAAGKLDPVSNSADLTKPEDSTTDHGKISSMPCMPCDDQD